MAVCSASFLVRLSSGLGFFRSTSLEWSFTDMASHLTQWLACGFLRPATNLRVLALYRLDNNRPICGSIPPLLVCLLPFHSTAPSRALRRFRLRNLPLRLPHRADANATLRRTSAAGASLSLRHSAVTSLRGSKLVRSGAALPSARETKGNRGSHGARVRLRLTQIAMLYRVDA